MQVDSRDVYKCLLTFPCFVFTVKTCHCWTPLWKPWIQADYTCCSLWRRKQSFYSHLSSLQGGWSFDTQKTDHFILTVSMCRWDATVSFSPWWCLLGHQCAQLRPKSSKAVRFNCISFTMHSSLLSLNIHRIVDKENYSHGSPEALLILALTKVKLYLTFKMFSLTFGSNKSIESFQ